MAITFDFSKALKDVDQAAYDNIPTDAQTFYVKGSDGKYAVKPEVLPLVETVIGVAAGIRDERAKVARLNAENTERRQALKPFEELAERLGVKVPEGKKLDEVFGEHVISLADAVKNGKDVKINVEKIQAEYQKELAKLTEASKAENVKLKGSLEKILIENAAHSALAEHKGNATLLLPHIKQQAKVVEEAGEFVVRVVDEKGDVRVNGVNGYMGVADLVKDMKANKVYAGAFASDSKGGTGTKPAEKHVGDRFKGRDENEMSAVDKIGAGLEEMFGNA